MKPFGWAIIGCGGIAVTVAKQLKKSGAGEIVAVWNRTASRAEEFSKKFGGKVFSTPEEAITAKGVEGVYVATTHDKHGEFTKLCVEYGIPVLCEKPFTVNYSEAEETFAYAKEKGVYVSEAMWTWHNSTAITVREWVKSGKIGQIKKVKATFAFPMLSPSANPRLLSPELIGGAVMDIGVYPLRYVYELFGMPKKLSCKGVLKGGVDVSENVHMDYGNFTAEIFVSMKTFKGEKLVIEGTEGKIVVPFFHCAKRAKITGRHGEKYKDKSLLYAKQMLQVGEEIRQGKKQSLFCPVRSTLDTMKLLDECRKQMGVIYPVEKN